MRERAPKSRVAIEDYGGIMSNGNTAGLELVLHDALHELRAQQALAPSIGQTPIRESVTKLLSSSLTAYCRLNALKRRAGLA